MSNQHRCQACEKIKLHKVLIKIEGEIYKVCRPCYKKYSVAK